MVKFIELGVVRRNETGTVPKRQPGKTVKMAGKQLFKHPHFAIPQSIQKLGGLGVAFGLAALLAVTAEVAAAPFYGAGVISQSRATILELFGSNLQFVHCCHTHPYPPYEE